MTRWQFWRQLTAIALHKHRLLPEYLATLGIGEHFFYYRHEVRAQLEQQLANLIQSQTQTPAPDPQFLPVAGDRKIAAPSQVS